MFFLPTNFDDTIMFCLTNPKLKYKIINRIFGVMNDGGIFFEEFRIANKTTKHMIKI